ncbi:hypothetical protein MMC13_004652 [Lambiella insularis]|nr:hypothetical protein [Lambiella insularis]
MPSKGKDQILDSAIVKVLSLAEGSYKVQSHGSSGFTSSSKLSANIDGKTKHFFIKTGPEGDMFKGEHASLNALHLIVPTICPASLAHGILTDSAGYFLLTEFMDVTVHHGGSGGSDQTLAQKLAKLHSTPAPVPDGYSQPMFGFPVTTFCGSTPQNNEYKSSWAEFYADNRLRGILKLVEANHGNDNELESLLGKIASEVVPKLLGDGHLGGSKGIQPVVVHGDLWSGNQSRGRIGESSAVEEVVFDPSSCYAHSEYEIGIMKMFGGFDGAFFDQYHKLLPKTESQDEYADRVDLYQL